MKRFWLVGLLALAGVAAFTRKVEGQAGSTPEVISIDPGAQSRPFPHFWEQLFGSGRAVLSMRESYRSDLRAVKRITGFEYVRFHAIFHDELGVYDEDSQGKPVYNFSYIDQIYDGLLENGVKPFVEISFMPRKLAANPQPHPFWYKPFPSPPNNPEKWDALIENFVQHLVDRYGKSEVEQWYFEVWNEPNIDFWNGDPKQETYFKLYDETARAVKKIDGKLRVGGPATAQAAWVDRFIAHATSEHVPFDFVSTHVYGNESSQDVFGNNIPIRRRDMVARSAKKVYDQVKASAAPNTPIIWSEYNATYLSQQDVTDSAFMGPWLANNIRECDGLTDMMSYWSLSDVFEEQGVVKQPFYGGYGLMAERNIPKAAFRAFELLHRLGDRRVTVGSEDALVTRRLDGTIVVALWNYQEPDEKGGSKAFQLNLKGAKGKGYRVQFVGPDNGSALDRWRKLGSPALPTRQQIQELVRASEMQPIQRVAPGQAITVGRQTLALVEVQR